MLLDVSASSSVAVSLLPEKLSMRLQRENVEAEMCSTALLIAQVILRTLDVLNNGELKKLDANPGNGSCQNIALEIRRLSLLDLNEETNTLRKTTEKLKQLVNKRKGSPKERKTMTASVFFNTYVVPLKVSKQMEFLLHSHLLWVTKVPYEKLSNGIVNTRSSPGRLGLFSKRITCVAVEFRRKIVEESQARHTLLSMETMRASAARLDLLAEEEKKLTELMLSEEHTHLYTSNERYKPKTYGCLFYIMKTVLFRLREQKALVCLKSITLEEKPFHILFQSKEEGKRFELVPHEAYSKLADTTRVVVFEAVVQLDRPSAAKQLVADGFSETILACTSREAPYERGSGLETVKDVSASKEIQLYREKSLGKYLILDHVFVNTLGIELVE